MGVRAKQRLCYLVCLYNLELRISGFVLYYPKRQAFFLELPHLKLFAFSMFFAFPTFSLFGLAPVTGIASRIAF